MIQRRAVHQDAQQGDYRQYCPLCDVRVSGPDAWFAHIRTIRHRLRLRSLQREMPVVRSAPADRHGRRGAAEGDSPAET